MVKTIAMRVEHLLDILDTQDVHKILNFGTHRISDFQEESASRANSPKSDSFLVPNGS